MLFRSIGFIWLQRVIWIETKNLQKLEAECKKFIPDEHMPKMCYEEDMNPHYLRGMYEKAMETGGKWW